MLAKILLANVAIILLFSSVHADYRPEVYCSLVPVGTKLPNLDDCHQYYTCVSSSMVNAAKCPNNQVFNKDSQSCITTPNGSCASLTNVCENQDKKWVPNPYVCGGWHYCLGGKIAGDGHCKVDQYFDYDQQMCKYGSCSIIDNNGGVGNLCLIMPNGKFFGDFEDCKTWHKCNGLQMKSGECKDTIYDSQKQQCVLSNGNTCGGPTTKCTEENDKIPDSAVCSNYFVCTGEKWKKQSCPNREFYDVNTKTCKSRQLATPVSTCDRCEYSTRPWVNAVDPFCVKYLFCKNGIKIDEAKCAKGFFNEELQRCSAGSDLEQYRKTNGACANPQSPPGDGEPGDGKPGDGKPGDGEPGDGKPGDGEPGDGKPGDGKPGDGEPGDGKPGDGKPGDGEPGDGKPGDGKPGEIETPTDTKNKSYAPQSN